MIRKDQSIRVRLGICLVAMLLGFALLILRAWQLQFWADDRVAKMEEKQTTSKEVLSPQRGTIFDRSGKVLAVNLQVPSIFADPSEIDDKNVFAKRVAPILAMSPKEILSKIKNRARKFVWLKRRTDPNVEPKLLDLDLAGVHVLHEGMRLYPDRQLASQLVGFVGMDGNGLEGIERLYEKYLKSEQLVVQSQKDARGRPIFTNDTLILEPEPGADLHLTIDTYIQHSVESELYEAARKSGSKRAMGVVMDPYSGQILAMASYPALNPNRLGQNSPDAFRNRPVEDMYEPGSTMKVFALAGALEEKAIHANQSIYCKKDSLKLSGKIIHNNDLKYHDWLTPAQVLKYSDNIGMSRISMLMGPQKLHATLKKFGFGSETGIDLSGEPRGMLKAPLQWKDIDLANISFGQGVGVSAIQMVSALSVIANGGFSVRPYVLDRVAFHDGRELKMNHPQPTSPVISKKTIEQIKDWMEGVVQEGGTGTLAALDGYRTAGKTGTAQKIDPATRRYSSKKVMSSFMGFAPLENPKLVSIFIFDEPEKADYGGTLAAPVFKQVMESSLAYMGVPRDFASPNRIALKTEKLPKKNTFEEPVSAANVGAGFIPDLRGLTVREVLAQLKELQIDVKIVGSGVAVKQFPKAGEKTETQRKLEIVFEPIREES